MLATLVMFSWNASKFHTWGMMQGEKEGKGHAGSAGSELTMVPSVVYACVCVYMYMCIVVQAFGT